MSAPILSVPPAANPNFPPQAVTAATPSVPNAGIFTVQEIEFMESVFWYWEENSPLARPFENTDPEADGYDPNLQMLTTVRAKLAALKPTVTT
jgi:hypothetical protein